MPDSVLESSGQATLDAATTALHLLQYTSGRKALVLVSDGADHYSWAKRATVAAVARKQRVPIYTVGVGAPGTKKPVRSVLAVDVSMKPNRRALQQAAKRYLARKQPEALLAVLPFGQRVATAPPLSQDKNVLQRQIDALRMDRESALFDAIHDAVLTLEAAQGHGRRAVVVVTGGRDTCSRHDADEVLTEARAAGFPLHIICSEQGDKETMSQLRRLAEATGGTYQPSPNERTLTQILENLSLRFHADGIDETLLRDLAEETGGEYVPVRDPARLAEVLSKIREDLETTYSATFPSRRAPQDDSARGIEIYVTRDGVPISLPCPVRFRPTSDYVPRLEPSVYLELLFVLAGLLAFPAMWRRWRHSQA